MLPAINGAAAAEVGMIGSRSSQKAAEYAGEFGCDYYGTYDDVLNNDSIDAVYISLPVGLHEEWAIRSAEAGKHILCEKSSTTSLESARKMVAACKKNGVRILEGFMFRYHPQHRKVIDMLAENILGNPRVFQGYFGFPFPGADDIRLKKELGGGVLNDAACYPVYASRMLFKEEPLSVFGKLIMHPELGIDVKADITLAYEKEKTAFISSAFGAYFQSNYSLWGDKAKLTVKRAYAVPKDRKTIIEIDADDKISEISIEPADHFRLMLEDFCRKILSGHKGGNDFESDLLNQARVLEAARISSREDCVVKLSTL